MFALFARRPSCSFARPHPAAPSETGTPTGQVGARSCGLLWLGVMLVLLLTAAPASAQCPLAWALGIGTPGADGTVRVALALPGAGGGGGGAAGGDVILGGDFLTAGGVAASRVARYNPTTGVWSPLGLGVNNTVYSLVVLPGGDVIVGGGFTTAGGVAANRVARYNPITGAWSPLGVGTSALVVSLLVLPGGDVLVGGQFTAAGGVAASGIARYNPTTGVWSALGLGITGSVFAMASLPGGDVLVGGSFTAAGGFPAANIARYNPTTGVWSAPGGGGTSSEVNSLVVLPAGGPGGGDVVMGGTFTTAGGLQADRIARYNPTTSTWSGTTCTGGTNNLILKLALLPDGDVLVGGQFATAGGVAASRIARYTPTPGGGAVWSAVGPGASSGVRAIAILADGSVILGGDFTSAGGAAATRVARLSRGGNPPSVVVQPLPVVTGPTGSALFYIAAIPGAGNSATPTFRWRRGGVPLDTTAHPSAATPILSLNNVQAADLGSYDCLVTDSCGASTPSNAVTLSFAGGPAGCSPADIAGSDGSPGSDGTINNGDFQLFFGEFFLGCP